MKWDISADLVLCWQIVSEVGESLFPRVLQVAAT
jgi:hypothetical protein